MVPSATLLDNTKRLSFALCFGWGTVLSAEPEPDPAELPRIPPQSLEEAQRSFEVREGFRVEIAAAEPQVVDPVAIAFDEQGRMFVAEMRGYPERREGALGRIKRLEDVDGDGRYEKATIFAEGLKWPTGLVCWKGGVLVSASPEILYLGDRDGDGVSDEKRVVFTGFGAGLKRLNMQALVNGLQWGPDGRIHGSTASNGGLVKANDPKAKSLSLRGSDFSFDPELLDLRAESGTGQYGLTFDDYGRRYLCSNSRHLIAVIYSWPWNKVSGLPHPLVDIPVDGGAAEVFRISQVEPWRVVRTRWRVQGLVGGPVEGGGRAAGYFTAASGLTVYRGDAFPKEFRGNVFVGDVGSNLVHRKVIEFPKDRVQPVARRAKGEEKREFLASPDNWFRPVQCANGPDGALYIVDMYRETIEHPWSIPESIKQHLDLYSGNERGRIWRVVPEGFKRPGGKLLGRPTLADLYRSLGSENGWLRDTCARLLLQRDDQDAATLLVPLIANAKSEDRARLCALRLFERTRAPGWFSPALLHDPSPELRRHTARLLEPAQSAFFKSLASDPDPRVRFEVALRALDKQVEIDASVLATLVTGAKGDPWILRTVAVAAKQRGVLSEVVLAQESLAAAQALLQAAKAGTGDAKLRPLFAKAAEVAADDSAPADERKAALWFLGVDGSTSAAALWKWVDDSDRALAGVAAEALAKRKPRGWEKEVFERWKRMAPAMRETFFSRMSAGAILSGVESGVLLPSEVSFQRKRSLLRDADAQVRARAKKLLGELPMETRKEAIAHYRPALLMKGEAERGEAVFGQRCAVCHEGREAVAAIGPVIASLRNKGAPMLLENIIKPDREIAPQYLLWEVKLKGGKSEAGMIGEETAAGLTVFRVDGTRQRIERGDIERLTNLNRSLMPAGLEAGLSLQEMADLLAYLTGPGS